MTPEQFDTLHEAWTNRASPEHDAPDWHNIALHMADNMARAVAEASEPDRLQLVGQKLERADGWRREYELARRMMREAGEGR